MKEIITCAVEAGVNPLERSVNMDMSPVGIFMRGHMIQNQLLVEVKKDFFQFLINLNPKSLIDFGPHNQCALETIARSDLSLWQQELPRIQVVMDNLQPDGIDKNLVWLEAAHKKHKYKSTQTVKEAIDRLRIKKEALFLNTSLGGAFPERKEKIHKI